MGRELGEKPTIAIVLKEHSSKMTPSDIVIYP